MRGVVATLCAGVLVVACSSTGVVITRSERITGPDIVTDTGPDSSPPTSSSAVDAADLPTIAPAVWAACAETQGRFQCARISVPLDYDNVDGEQIDLALIRLPATQPDQRIGSLVLNPGGPGGSGLELVTGEAEYFPDSVTDRFDIVGFDPRGVGESSAVHCPSSSVPTSDTYDDCIGPNATVLPHLGTANVARDLEMIRRAIGDTMLTYLGFSYGTAIGAVYADLFPDRIRSMVLDGAVDPDAELSNTPAGGDDFYAEQDFDSTIAAFEDLCDAAVACAAGPHTRQLIDRITRDIETLGVESFPQDGRLDQDDLDDLLENSMYSVDDWPILAVALADAGRGDASTLSALYSWLLYGYPADVSSEADKSFANVAIRCADFARRDAGAFDCANFPDTARALPVITPVDTSAPVLVIGTKDDPATPARYAPRLARALGDAVAIEWEGAGHTATLTSACVTDLVALYLIEAQVPIEGTTCPFVVGATSFAARAGALFAQADPELTSDALSDVLEAEGEPAATAACVADSLVRRGDQRLVVHQLLGVESPELLAVRGMLDGQCD